MILSHHIAHPAKGRKAVRRCRLGVVAVALALVACGSPRDAAMADAAQAQALMDAGDLNGARAAVLRSLALRDDIPEVHTLNGRIALGTNDPLAAYQAFSRVLELDAANMDALLAVSELALQLGRVRDAETISDRALALDPNASRALLVKGLIALDRKRIAEAIGYADKILEFKANDEGGIVLKARALATDGDYDGGRAVIEAARGPAAQSEAMMATLLEIDRARGDVSGLRRAFERLVERMPRNAELKIDYANTLYKSGDVAAARAILRPFFAAPADDRASLNAISALWTEYDRNPFSPGDLEAIARKGSPAQRETAARYYLNTGRTGIALKILAPTGGGSTGLEGLYARALHAEGRSAQAREIIAQILERDKLNPDALLLRATLLQEEKRFSQAIIDAQTVLRDNPENPDAYWTLAQALAAHGQAPRARQILEQGARLLPQSAFLYNKYIHFLYHINDMNRAMSLARTFALASPASLVAWKQYEAVCLRVRSDCVAEARKGHARSRTLYSIDPRPGTPPKRSLFGRL
jgi:tetratricopeptide (TPR) repeat protein